MTGRPVKPVRQGAEYERRDSPDHDEDGTGQNLVLDPLAVVKVFAWPCGISPCVTRSTAPKCQIWNGPKVTPNYYRVRPQDLTPKMERN